MNIPFKPLYDLWKVLNHYNQATIKHKQINNSIKPDANIMVCLQDELVFFFGIFGRAKHGWNIDIHKQKYETFNFL